MTFREFLGEDAGVVGNTVAGQWRDGPNNYEFAARGVRSKYIANDKEPKKRIKTAKFFLRKLDSK